MTASPPLRCPSARCGWLFGWGAGYAVVTDRAGQITALPPSALVLRCPRCNQCVIVAPAGDDGTKRVA